jgi:hypothetical protein
VGLLKRLPGAREPGEAFCCGGGRGANFEEPVRLGESVVLIVQMLSNFETPREKLMHIILAGQSRLAERPQITQLRQRVSIVARLNSFENNETRSYLEHCMHTAGYSKQVLLFASPAYDLITAYRNRINLGSSLVSFRERRNHEQEF